MGGNPTSSGAAWPASEPRHGLRTWAVRIGLVAVAILAAVVLAHQASASHFRAGTMQWHRIPVASTPAGDVEAWQVSMTAEVAFRTTYYYPTPGSALVGDIIPCASMGVCPVNWGDCTTSDFDMLVTAVDVGADTIYVRFVQTGTTLDLSHQYPAPNDQGYTSCSPLPTWVSTWYGAVLAGIPPAVPPVPPSVPPTVPALPPAPAPPAGNPWQITWGSSARLSSSSGHVNNPDQSWLLTTDVDLTGFNHSPIATLVPIHVCYIGLVCTFPTLAADADGDVLSFRKSTSVEATGTSGFDQPGPPDSTYASLIDPATGVVTWDTRGARLGSPFTYYSMQVMVEDGQTHVPLDYFIRLDPPPPPSPPPPPKHPSIAAFTSKASTACGPVTVDFKDITKVGDIGAILAVVKSWSWEFGDGGMSLEQNPSHTYTNSGVYRVRLVIVDDQGDTSDYEVSISILVRACPVPRTNPAEDANPGGPPRDGTDATLAGADGDSDGVADASDDCPWVSDPYQVDLDADGLGDACDADRDGDGIGDDADVCLAVPDAVQADLDADGIGDACDGDVDGDAVAEAAADGSPADNCPRLANTAQADLDANGIGDACDTAARIAAGAAAPDRAAPDVRGVTAVDAPAQVGTNGVLLAGVLAATGLALAIVAAVARQRRA